MRHRSGKETAVRTEPHAKSWVRRTFSFLSMRFFLICLCFLLVILIVINTLPMYRMKQMVIESKQSEMISTGNIIANSLSVLQILDTDRILSVMSMLDLSGNMRIIIVNSAGMSIYDSVGAATSVGKYLLLSELHGALDGYDAFRCICGRDAFESTAAVPVFCRDSLLGAVFLYDLDSSQMQVLEHLRQDILLISLVLGLLAGVLLFFMTRIIQRRTRALSKMIAKVRSGDYSERLKFRGTDELALLSRDLNALSERLQKTEELRRRFVSDASHELRTPLAVAKLLSDSITETENMPLEDIREFASNISEEIERLTRITDHLTELTKLDSGIERPVSYVDVSAVVRRAEKMLKPLAASRGITISSTLSDDCIAEANEDSLYQIVFNLMENAVKYNYDNGSVHAITYLKDSRVYIIVDDTGVGIPEEDLTRIFDRFYRVDKARSRETGGTGLGLSIVRQMAAQYGGTVTAENRKPNGSRFIASFPNRREARP